jgi:hypothetical protein
MHGGNKGVQSNSHIDFYKLSLKELNKQNMFVFQLEVEKCNGRR